MLALLALLQAAAADSLPRVTLAEALRRAARLDPDYVAAIGQVDDAAWARRSALAVFILPALSVSTDLSRFSTPIFNVGTSKLQNTIVDARIDARYDLFLGGQKFAEWARARAALDGAQAGELKARFASALLTESDYYAVLAGRELLRVAADRVQRAGEQLAIARARVVSGAAVQTDSLQLRLELNRARVGLLRQEAGLRVARLELGRRVGIAGPVDAVPLDTEPAPELPLTLDAAVQEALAQGPEYRVARATERAAAASYRARLGAYVPHATLSASSVAIDDRFFPRATTRSSITLTVSFPLWDNGQREVQLTQARVNRDVARAIRDDVQRSVGRDVTGAYDGYTTARASAALAADAVVVARENFRVQQSRYSAGATTILDLLEAQLALTEAEADLVQARYATRLALAGLESILGRRLFPN